MKLTALTVLAVLATSASAQTTTTTKRSTSAATHRAVTTPAAPAPAVQQANPADNPPNIPKVEGTPKTLYALRYIDITEGTGEPAVPRRYYTVHYTGWLTDGTKFDSSVDHGTPFTFPYGARQVIPGWDTGFTGMRVGGKRRLFIPWQLAYGESGRPPVIPPKADLIFDLELISQSETDPRLAPQPAPESTPQPQSSQQPSSATPPPGIRPKAPAGDVNQKTNPSAPQTPPHPESH